MNEMKLGAMGWQRDLPDFRDFTTETEEVQELVAQSQPFKASAKEMPKSVDLKQYCQIQNQGRLGSCTANAGVSLMEYYQRRAFGHFLDGSRLFLYKTTRNLLGWTGDTGAYLRSTMKSMVLFGIPPEKYWEYNIADFENEPPAFCYSLAQSYQAKLYYRHDSPGMSTSKVLASVKRYLAANLPCMFGFTVYDSMPGLGEGTGEIPFPEQNDKAVGGHAVVAVGYDDNKRIGRRKGALLIQNSWGTGWGEKGFGWLPYAYVEAGLAVDFWSLMHAEFVNTKLFE